MSDKEKPIKEQLGEDAKRVTPETQQFRGAAISITEKGQYGMTLAGGVKILEVYGVLTLLIEKMRADLGV